MNFAAGTKLYHYVLDLEDKTLSMKKFMSDAENFSKVYDIFGLDFPTIDIPASPFGNT